jgi:hypothetical protein
MSFVSDELKDTAMRASACFPVLDLEEHWILDVQ